MRVRPQLAWGWMGGWGGDNISNKSRYRYLQEKYFNLKHSFKINFTRYTSIIYILSGIVNILLALSN